MTEPDHIFNQGFTYQIRAWWGVNLDYRYSRMTSEGTGNFGSLFSQDVPSPATTPATGQAYGRSQDD